MKRFVPHFPIYVVAAFLLIAVISLSGCSQNDLPGGDDNDTLHCTALTVQVTDRGYSPAEGTHPDTRATENGYKTQFTTGDKIGLYAVKNSAIVTGCTNLCLTLTDDGNGNLSWTLPVGSGLWYEGASAGITYYAYYPYQPNTDMTGKVTPTATDASVFFNELEEKWAPATDQSTPAAYTAQDLMTGIGTVSGNGTSHTLTFNFTHQMALAVIKTPITKYELKDASGISLPDYTLPAPDLTFNGFTPCGMSDGSYRYLVNPCLKQSQPQLSGSYTNATDKTQEFIFTPDIDTGTYKTYTVDNATVTEKTHILQAGDFYMKDGSLVGKGETLSEAQKAACIGIVCWVGSDAFDEDPLLKRDYPDCTHGLVVALQDASTSNSFWSSRTEDITSNWLSRQGSWNPYIITTLQTTDKMQGYANTKALEGYNESDRVKDNPNLKVLPVGLIADYGTPHSTPASSSGWYCPSVKELKHMCWGQGNSSGVAGRDMLNAQLGKVPGAASLQRIRYWSSTENSYYAWDVNFSDGAAALLYKDLYAFGVRAVLAF